MSYSPVVLGCAANVLNKDQLPFVIIERGNQVLRTFALLDTQNMLNS
ncbi:MAG TPA: hypothetical protein PLP19_14045 [bacterium]|nr:hypothetical protein [bacterium]HPN44610.1 hypothetical protein [bacterium]